MYLCRAKKRDVTYLYLIDIVYDKIKKKSVKKIHKSFGRYDVFAKEHPDELKKLEEMYGSKKEKYKVELETGIKSFIESVSSGDNFSQKYRFVSQRLSYYFLRKIWKDDLQMVKFFAHLSESQPNKISFSPSVIALYYATLKIVSPSSHLSGINQSPRFLGDPLQDIKKDDVYRCLKYLSDNKDSIMTHVNKMVNNICPRSKSLIFYDCTNCYFETPYSDEYLFKKKAIRKIKKALRNNDQFKNLSDNELDSIIQSDSNYKEIIQETIESFGEPLRMYGVSKEKRFDLPIVMVALVIDENAMPIDFHVFPGNKAEQKTMIEAVHAVKKKYNIKNAIFVSDSALNSAENLSMLINENMGFSVSKSALTFSRETIENHLDRSSFLHMKDESGNNTPYLYKIIDYSRRSYIKNEYKKTKPVNIHCKMMITFSKSRYDRDVAVLNNLLNRARQAIKNSEKVTVRGSGWKQFVRTEAKPDDNKYRTAISLNEELIERRKQCAGYAGILFSPPPNINCLEPEYISTLYHHLVQIEDCFRILKNNIDIRPMYVRNPENIKGHVLICVLALIILRIIQRRLSGRNVELSIERISSLLDDLKMTLFKNNNDYILLKTEEFERKDIKDNSKLQSETSTNLLIKALGYKPFEKAAISFAEIRDYFGLRSLSLSSYQQSALEPAAR